MNGLSENDSPVVPFHAKSYQRQRLRLQITGTCKNFRHTERHVIAAVAKVSSERRFHFAFASWTENFRGVFE
jgi:hypothetical protein